MFFPPFSASMQSSRTTSQKNVPAPECGERKYNYRSRTKYSPEQLETLERMFSITQYPDTDTMDRLAITMDVSADKISIWFQNRRSKFKRQSKGGHVTWMRKQIFQNDTGIASPELCSQSKILQKRHVLSPPEKSSLNHGRSTWDKPSTNLHYIPKNHGHEEALLNQTIHQSTESFLYNTTTQPTASPGNILTAGSYTALQLSHLLNDQSLSPGCVMSPTPAYQSVFPRRHNSDPFNPSSYSSYPAVAAPPMSQQGFEYAH